MRPRRTGQTTSPRMIILNAHTLFAVRTIVDTYDCRYCFACLWQEEPYMRETPQGVIDRKYPSVELKKYSRSAAPDTKGQCLALTCDAFIDQGTCAFDRCDEISHRSGGHTSQPTNLIPFLMPLHGNVRLHSCQVASLNGSQTIIDMLARRS